MLNARLNVSTCAFASTTFSNADRSGNSFYANPPGAILPIAGHKGYGLAVMCEILAVALTGGGCSNPANADRLANGMLSIILDSYFFQSNATFAAEIERFIEWVKSSETVNVEGEILMPGEIEERTKVSRLRDGLDLDAMTWSQIVETAKSVGIDVDANSISSPRAATAPE